MNPISNIYNNIIQNKQEAENFAPKFGLNWMAETMCYDRRHLSPISPHPDATTTFSFRGFVSILKFSCVDTSTDDRSFVECGVGPKLFCKLSPIIAYIHCHQRRNNSRLLLLSSTGIVSARSLLTICSTKDKVFAPCQLLYTRNHSRRLPSSSSLPHEHPN